MSAKNCELLDYDEGRFSALGFVMVQLVGPFLWHTEDIEEEGAPGVIFRAFESTPDLADEERKEVGSIIVIDATDEASEPDVSVLAEGDVEKIDDFLRQDLQQKFAEEGMELTQWKHSRLIGEEPNNLLVTGYVVRSDRQLQFTSIRQNLNGRKLVTTGVFDMSMKELASGPILHTLKSIQPL